ncbi:MAG: cytochrome c [Cyclobacteriaceae bacterium]|nr:cytochrome c [Cyclobacteriaceae bacterium]
MKSNKSTYLILISLLFIASCGSSTQEKDNTSKEPPKSMLKSEPATLEEAERDWKDNKGIGPVSGVELAAEIDQKMAEEGKAVYEAKCTACHKAEKQFIGPAPKGIMARRTPEWIMNMILNPEGMVAEDPIAKQLLIKFNGSPMANQNLTEQEARTVVEYFRTLN